MSTLESQIGEWRAAVVRGRAIDESDADELESHLREQIAELEAAGLSDDEAFVIGVKRLGEVSRLTAEFAREHSDRLWKQLAMANLDENSRQPVLVMLGFAALTAVLVQASRLLAEVPGSTNWFLLDLRVMALPVLAVAFSVFPVVAAYFTWQRRISWRRAVGLAVTVVVLAAVTGLYPFTTDSSTGILVAIHLPVLLWLIVGVAYLGGELRSPARRMDFIRFSGEWLIYYTLIAIGGAVLMALTIAVLSPIAPDAIEGVVMWVVPSGAAGAVVVAAWLVEAKKSIVENLAPVLTAIFTPLFALMLLVSAVGYGIAGFGLGLQFDRNLLTVFDVLLLVVLGLVVYGISARAAAGGRGVMAVIQVVAVVAAILLDIVVLISMFARIGEFGFTANRVAALGLNLLLLVNLAGTAWLALSILLGRARPARLERWQTGYLPVFAGWVVLVVLALPPIFGFA